MLTERMMLLSSDLYDYTFQMVDGENEAYGNDAGRIATAVQRAFEAATLADDPDELAARIILDAQRDGELQYDLELWPELTPVRGNAMCSGDDEVDREYEDKILDALERGNEWAWCTVRVTCQVPGYGVVGDDWLGCCSYNSLEDFEECAYHEDMKTQARHALQTALSEHLEKR